MFLALRSLGSVCMFDARLCANCLFYPVRQVATSVVGYVDRWIVRNVFIAVVGRV